MQSTTFDHGADVGVAGTGSTLEEAFCGAARAMFGLMADVDAVAPRQRVEIQCEAADREFLLVRWLNALLAEAAIHGLLFSRFEARIQDERRLAGAAWGEPLDPDRHDPGVEVKGATLTALEVVKDGGGWRARTVVDV